MNLESHCEERKNTIKNNSDQIFITKFIPEFFNFTDSTNEEILKVTGIVQVRNLKYFGVRNFFHFYINNKSEYYFMKSKLCDHFRTLKVFM